MPKQHTLANYIAFGAVRDLTFLDDAPPKNVKTHGNWKCNQCGKVFKARMETLRAQVHPCRCRQANRLRATHYQAMAEKLNIEWLGPLPANQNEKTGWRYQNDTFSECYSRLRHSTMKASVRDILARAAADRERVDS